MNDQNPRQIAARILAQRLNSSEFTENLLEIALANARLSPADRGLCHELVCGVVRWQAALDRLIERKTTPGRPQRPVLQNLLRLGLYQIFWLDRIPPHAAVHETVELAKRAGFEHQVGFLNAVLRGYLREAEAIKKILADQKISQPALGYSHPEWLVEKWRQQFGDDNTRQLLEWNNRPPNTFARLNSLKTDPANLAERWREENVTCDFVSRDWLGEKVSFELISHPPLAGLGSFRDGWFYLQDPSTLLAPALLDAQPNATILDLCAAPGGKATFIAQQMNNTGKLILHDLSPDRLRLIRENCKRLGVTNADIIMPTTGIQQMLTSFDRILVDAPCSNTGVMRRRVDLRWRIQSVEIERLRTTQLELLHSAAAKLKPGGVIVYSTCSLEPEENSELVQQFLAMNPSFKLEAERQLLPFVDDVDGAYVAKLKHSA